MNTRSLLGALGLCLLSSSALAVGCAVPVGEGAESSDEAFTGFTVPVGSAGSLAPVAPVYALVDVGEFTVTGLAHKCIDFGGAASQAIGSPVYLFGCNGTIAQRVHVMEIGDGTHDVSLRAGTRFCFGVRGGAVVAGQPLELQACDTSSPAQRFAVDGDTIYMGFEKSGRVARQVVIEAQSGRSADRTPLIVGSRQIDDAEDFRFTTSFTASVYPTMGFTRVYTLSELDHALATARWGSVIDVAPTASITIDDLNERTLGEGVTLRSDRRGMHDGGVINRHSSGEGTFLRITGNDARITGLRLVGPSTTTDDDAPLVKGIQAPQAFRVTIDHNELTAWTEAAVSAEEEFDDTPECPVEVPTLPNVRVIKNLIHQNSREGYGYGVVSYDGANPHIEGNDFDHNRHAIASDSNGNTHYDAEYNLVTAGNTYCSVWPFCWKEQDFDVHGSGDGSHHQGGIAGGFYTITSNTLYSEDKNIDIRGTPCELVSIRNNVFIESQGTAIKNATEVAGRVQITSNTFSAARSTGVTGDFDGDGVQDLFMATGAAWYYRPGGTKEWRYLNRYSTKIPQLTFGDFDGDGRTDVRTGFGASTLTSWGGASIWDSGTQL